jgi:hypothetical protein
MTKIPTSLLSVAAMLVHIIIIPVFLLGFVLIYESQWAIAFLSAGNGAIFNILILTSILLGILCGSRIPMTAVRNRPRMSWWQYSLWSFSELFVFSCFAALYMALVYRNIGYFPALGKCLQLTFAILPYPYIIFALLFALIRPDEQATAEEDLIRFADSTGRLKLVIAHDVLLYVEAQENYVSIHYLEGEKIKEYSLRQSMRGIEELMEKHGIVRCQRSYFVNPRHVTVLRRDKEGFIQAELDIKNSKSVPVSPKYYEQLSKLL